MRRGQRRKERGGIAQGIDTGWLRRRRDVCYRGRGKEKERKKEKKRLIKQNAVAESATVYVEDFPCDSRLLLSLSLHPVCFSLSRCSRRFSLTMARFGFLSLALLSLQALIGSGLAEVGPVSPWERNPLFTYTGANRLGHC